MELNQAIAELHGDLRRLADWHMSRERRNHTLQPTALLNEVYLKLIGDHHADYSSRAHFLAAAAMAMRRVLIDHAKVKRELKHGGIWNRLAFDDFDLPVRQGRLDQLDIMWLHDALEKLATQNQRACDVAICRCFAGMTVTEIAEAMDWSERTVAEDWAWAKRWLSDELER